MIKLLIVFVYMLFYVEETKSLMDIKYLKLIHLKSQQSVKENWNILYCGKA